MFVWSSSASPVSDVFAGHENDHKEVKLAVSPKKGFFFFHIYISILILVRLFIIIVVVIDSGG